MPEYETKNSPEWLVRMPKTEVHCHLAGSTRLNTLLELADSYGVDLGAKTEDALRKKVVFKNQKRKSLASYLKCIALCESVFVKPEAFKRAAYEICEDANKENVRIIEIRFGPTNYQKNGLKLPEIMEATLDGIAKAKKDFGMLAGLIVCGIRTDREATKRAAEIAVNYHYKGVVGFDLAGQENGFRPKEFEDIISPVLHSFIPVTVHAGEEDTVASIADAFIYLNARRIGHGVSLCCSQDILRYMDETRAGLEVCLTSNIDTGAVASYQTHPVKFYFGKNIRVSLNTDNRTVSDTTLINEYMHLMNELGFTKEDIFRVARHGIKSAFIGSSEKTLLIDELNAFREEK